MPTPTASITETVTVLEAHSAAQPSTYPILVRLHLWCTNSILDRRPGSHWIENQWKPKIEAVPTATPLIWRDRLRFTPQRIRRLWWNDKRLKKGDTFQKWTSVSHDRFRDKICDYHINESSLMPLNLLFVHTNRFTWCHYALYGTGKVAFWWHSFFAYLVLMLLLYPRGLIPMLLHYLKTTSRLNVI